MNIGIDINLIIKYIATSINIIKVTKVAKSFIPSDSEKALNKKNNIKKATTIKATAPKKYFKAA
ncbi:hypothetical protein IBB3154_127 (plasmid) [Ligilactobacillus salivarius]|nr:hypothetical protein IBB3154_127 [Ligilactobacillus salivarius]